MFFATLRQTCGAKACERATLKIKSIMALCGFVGVLLPAVVLIVDRLAPHGWWPRWVFYVWPTSYMLGANSAFTPTVANVITAVSVGINALIYALYGLLAFRPLR